MTPSTTSGVLSGFRQGSDLSQEESPVDIAAIIAANNNAASKAGVGRSKARADDPGAVGWPVCD